MISMQNIAIFVVLTSALALAGAYTAQYVFNLRPCELCLIQRVPFALNIVLGVIAIFWEERQRIILALTSVIFFINSGIALFHSGVERKWWAGLTGCTTPDMSGTIDDLMKRIQETDVVRCDEIPWSFAGLSMANYNVAFCLGIAAILAFALLKTLEKQD